MGFRSIDARMSAMLARMTAMHKLAKDGSEEALTYMHKMDAEYDKVSTGLKTAVLEAESIARTVIDDLNPLAENIIDMTNVPALLARAFVQAYTAFRPTKQQATATADAFDAWRKATREPNRLLVDALEQSLRVSVRRWIDTLEDEPTTEPKAAAALSDLPPIGEPQPTPDKPLSADKV